MATVDLSPEPEIEREASDDESANQQLLTESQSSQPSRPHPMSSVVSANLLNAARANTRGSTLHPPPQTTSLRPQTGRSSGIMAKRAAFGAEKKGKLTRPSFLSADLRKTPGSRSTRRGDVYDIPESPEKKAYKLPQTVNRTELKVVKRSKGKRADDADTIAVAEQIPDETIEVEAQEDGEDQEMPDAEDEAPPPPSAQRSPTSARPNRQRTDTESPGRRKSGRLAGEHADIDHIVWEQKPEDQVSPRRSKRKASAPAHVEAEKPSKVAKRTHQKNTAQEAQAQGRVTRSGKSNAASTDTISSGRRKEKTSKAKGKPAPIEEELPANVVEEEEEEEEVEGEEEYEEEEGEGEEEDQENEESLFVPEKRPSKGITKASATSTSKTTNIIDPEDFEATKTRQQPERDEDDHTDDHYHTSEPTVFDKPFRYLDRERRRGNCRTAEAKALRLFCKSCRTHLVEDGYDFDVEKVKDMCKLIRENLTKVNRTVAPDNHLLFKEDAYSFVFFSLGRLLEAVHDWTRERFGNPEQSIPALDILIPLIANIFTFQDMLTSWSVSLPSRPKGDRLIKDVVDQFTAPLRHTFNELRQIKKYLEKVETIERARQEAQARQMRERQEEQRKYEEEKHRAKWWSYWKHLHTQRQLCEPSIDKWRRDHLRIKPLSKVANTVERDANGVEFQREPFFRERSIPFSRSPNRDGGVEWDATQLEALIAGLQKYSGPAVFERIFRRYCKPGGPLRDFNVEEITSQAAEFKSTILDRIQSEGWETPKWIEKIPVLS